MGRTQNYTAVISEKWRCNMNFLFVNYFFGMLISLVMQSGPGDFLKFQLFGYGTGQFLK